MLCQSEYCKWCDPYYSTWEIVFLLIFCSCDGKYSLSPGIRGNEQKHIHGFKILLKCRGQQHDINKQSGEWRAENEFFSISWIFLPLLFNMNCVVTMDNYHPLLASCTNTSNTDIFQFQPLHIIWRIIMLLVSSGEGQKVFKMQNSLLLSKGRMQEWPNNQPCS